MPLTGLEGDVETNAARLLYQTASLRPLDTVEHDVPFVATHLHDLQPLEAHLRGARREPEGCAARSRSAEDGNESALEGPRSAVQRDVQTHAARLAPQSAALAHRFDPHQHDRVVVAAAPLHDKTLEAGVLRAREQLGRG